MAKVVINNISKSYDGKTRVLKDFNLEIASGEMFFLLGPSGCGKSTLLRILAGLVEQDSGSISFDDVDITDLPPEKRRAAMVFQNYALWPHLDVFENVAFGLRNANVKGAELKEKVMEALELVRLADLAKRKVPSLSGGQQQRIALARALAVEPSLLLLDEPLSNLDARLRDAMRNEISRICAKRNQTALYVTHDRQEALSMADRLAVLKDGSIRQMGTPEELYDFPADRFCAEFLGDVNIIPGREENGVFVSPLGNFKYTCKYPEGKLCGLIRPERIRFAADGDEGAFKARLTGRTFLGESCDWKAEANGVEFCIRESAPRSRKLNEEVSLKFDEGYFQLVPERD